MTTPHSQKQRGFTLLEVLVAMVISSMLLMVLMQGYAMVTRGWEERFQTFSSTLEQTRRQHLVVRSMEAMAPFQPMEDSPADTAGGSAPPPFFTGEPQRMEWVTATPVFYADAAIATLQATEQNGNRVWRYHERPLGHALAPDQQGQQEESARQGFEFMPAESQHRLEFEGYDSLDRIIRNAMSGPEHRAAFERETPKWRSQYDSKETGMLPQRVRIVSRERTLREFDITASSIRHAQSDF